jgi:hypothetical protein
MMDNDGDEDEDGVHDDRYNNAADDGGDGGDGGYGSHILCINFIF